jgi:hypothetical protein
MGPKLGEQQLEHLRCQEDSCLVMADVEDVLGRDQMEDSAKVRGQSRAGVNSIDVEFAGIVRRWADP